MPLTPFPSSLIPLCIITSLTTMVLQRTHLLMTLLALETMILNLLALIMFNLNTSSSNNLLSIMVLLTFGACEAALGLACLVNMTRNFGNEQIASPSLYMC
uniref:NADH-ubiquinone oxidoreductase chain 4L n=1 Tax=Pelagomacellicephala iliffei TaxID=1960706 RepID=A0A8E7IV36_9ANNE|nr:NADH dehydrogenase subunit 4L [Pelagomacellicephala iliffei]